MPSIHVTPEISGLGYWEFDLIEKKLHWSNQVFYIFGLDPAGFAPSEENFYKFVHPDDKELVYNAYYKTLAEQNSFEIQHRIIVKGEIRYVMQRCETVFDKDGTPIKSLGSTQDVTETVHAQNQLEATEKKFKAISNQTTEGITVADLEGNYVFVNPAFCRMSGYTEEELLKLTVFDMKSPNQDHSSFKNTKEDMEGQPVHVILQKKTGEEYHTEIIGDLINIEGESLVLGTIRDITDRVKREELLNKFNAELEMKVEERTNQLNETIYELSQEVEYRKEVESRLKDTLATKEILFKEITHRVKNNMQIISSLINLQKSNLSAEAGEFLEQISRRIHSMALIHETLYKTNEFEKIQYDGYLQSLIDYIRESYHSENITFKLKADKSLLPLSVGTSLGMIVMELVSNSMKHAFPDKSAKGTVEIAFIKIEKGHYRLTISDNGTGIPKDVDFRNTKTLGLQLVFGLLEQIDGSISLEQKDGEGCVFVIEFGFKGEG